ncbi:hypothetical protein Tco_0677148 [Tanacetum coccineum]
MYLIDTAKDSGSRLYSLVKYNTRILTSFQGGGGGRVDCDTVLELRGDAKELMVELWNSTGRARGRPGKSSGNTPGKSQTIGTSFTCFPFDLSSSFLADICAKKTWHPLAMYS